MKHCYPLLQNCFLVRIVAALLLLSGWEAGAQIPHWQLALASVQASGSFNSANVRSTVADANGNVYLVGSFTGNVRFGNASLSTSIPSADIFVAKWSAASGNFEWAQSAGGSGDDYAFGVALIGTSVYVTGLFNSATATFGSTVLLSAGLSDAFVAKLTESGANATFTWAQRAGGSSGERITDLAINGSSIYLVGSSASPTADFGPLSISNSYQGSTTYDGFVAKLTDAGPISNFVWVQKTGGQGDEQIESIGANGTAIYVAGSFNGSGTATTFGSTALTSVLSDGFVAKLVDAGATGSFVWAKPVSGPSYDNAHAVAVQGTSVYLAGDFTNSAAFGTVALTGGLNVDAFAAKLIDGGIDATFAWAKRMGGTAAETATAIAVNGPDVYVTGNFYSHSADFGSSILTNAVSTGTSYFSDVFVAKLVDTGPAGTFAWAQSAGGTGGDFSYTLALAGAKAYVAGSLTPTANFGSISITSPLGSQVAYLASITDAPLTTSAPPKAFDAVSIFPNPAHGRATVQLPSGAGPATLTILDALGRTLRTQTTTTQTNAELDLTGLAPGLYAVRVAAAGSTATRRLVVE